MESLFANAKPIDSVQTAIIFSGELIRQLESSELRLPTTYIGVRQVRPAGGKVKETGGNRKRGASETFDKIEDVDDSWAPNAIFSDANTDTNTTEPNSVQNSSVIKPHAITFKVTNPDGTERRMSAQEKKKLKQEMKQAQSLARKEQKQIEVKERIRVDKEKKKERKRLKLLAKQKKSQNTDDGAQTTPPIRDKSSSSLDDQAEMKSNALTQEDQDEETERKYRGNPPVVLTPAATRVAFDLGALSSNEMKDNMKITTVLDDELAKQWASQINESMVPAEQQRANEDIRQMPYKLVPEVWNRLRPKTKSDTSIAQKLSRTGSFNRQSFDIATLRNPSPSLFDESSYLIFKHLHQHFNLHLACGARFGCDYLVYDGRREEKHSFAGLRVYHVRDGSSELPAPSAYDLHGFVRAMNTARKLALIATVRSSSDEPHVARIAVVDVALEAILTAPTHIKKGNTDKRRFVGDTNELIKRKT